MSLSLIINTDTMFLKGCLDINFLLVVFMYIFYHLIICLTHRLNVRFNVQI